MKRRVIAVVDDNEAYLELLCELINDEGYQGVLYNNGANSYDQLVADVPDVIILDMQIEELDSGLQLLKRLRDTRATQHTPIIFCTADSHFLRTSRTALQRTYHCDVLEKPFDIDDLLQKIHNALDGQTARHVGDEPTA